MTHADEFLDLMPHIITVTDDMTEPDEHGQTPPDPATLRKYRCLIDDTTSVVKTAEGDEITVALTAYVNATPIDHSTPWPIKSDANVEFTPPPAGQPVTRPLRATEFHYDETGDLHNQVLRFQ